MDEEEIQVSDAGSEIEKVQWKKESKKGIINQTAGTRTEFFRAKWQIVDNDQSRICLITTNKEE